MFRNQNYGHSIEHIAPPCHIESVGTVKQQVHTCKLSGLTVTCTSTVTDGHSGPTADMSNQRRLQSASSNQLDDPSFHLPTVGSRAFLIATAKVWNSLPDDVTSALSLSTFRRHLKTYLFRCCYNTD